MDRLLKLDPNNITLVKQQQDLLKDSISKTSDKLSVLKTAQKQVEEQFKNGDIGRDKYIAFQKELVNTSAQLDKLKSQKDTFAVIKAPVNALKESVSDLTDKLKPVTTGLKSVASASKEITSVGIKTVSTAVNSAEKALKMYSATATACVTAVSGITVSSALFADDMNTLSKVTGISTAELQKFNYATNHIDVSMDTLTGAMTKNTKAMASAKSGSATYVEAYARLDVAVTNVDGTLRNSQDVFNESIDALGKISNETERDALAMSLFGKSAQELNPLILGGAEQLKILGDEAEKAGFVLSQDALDSLNAFNDSIDTMKANVSAGTKVIATQFAPSFQKVTDIIGQAVPKITTAFTKLVSGDNTDFTSELTSLGTKLLSGFNKAVPTFLKGMNSVILSVANSVTQTLPQAINTVFPAMITGLTDLVNGLVKLTPDFVPQIVTGGVVLFTGLLQGLNDVTPQLMAQLPVIINNVADTLIENLPIIISSGFELLVSLMQGISEAIPTLIESISDLIPVIVSAITDNLPQILQAGIGVVIALAEGFPKAIPELIKAVPQLVGAIISTIFETNWLDVGVQIIKGIACGLVEGVKSIGSVIASVGNSIVNSFKSFFGIHSPSRLFRDEVGTYLAQGIGVGFTEEMDNVTKSMQKVLPTNFETDVKLNSSYQKQQPQQTVNFTQNNYSPKSLSRYEIYRQTKNLMATGGAYR